MSGAAGEKIWTVGRGGAGNDWPITRTLNLYRQAQPTRRGEGAYLSSRKPLPLSTLYRPAKPCVASDGGQVASDITVCIQGSEVPMALSAF